MPYKDQTKYRLYNKLRMRIRQHSKLACLDKSILEQMSEILTTLPYIDEVQNELKPHIASLKLPQTVEVKNA